MPYPLTKVERTGVRSDLAEEEVFLKELDANTDVNVKIIGRSTEGRPIFSCSIGNPNGPTLFLCHGQHGSEWGARESAQTFLRDLAYRPSSLEASFLQSNQVVVVPTANPDGKARGQRNTTMNTDSNRSWYGMLEPETIAIKRLMNSLDIMLLVDVHEHNPNSPNQMSWSFEPGHPLVGNQFMFDVAAHSEPWMLSYLDSHNITHQRFPINPNEPMATLRSHSMMNHIPSFLLETIMRRPVIVRVEVATQFYKGALEYMSRHKSYLEDKIQSSKSLARNRLSPIFYHSQADTGRFTGIVEVSDPGSYTIPEGVAIPYDTLEDLQIGIDGRTIQTNQLARQNIATFIRPDSFYYFGRDGRQRPPMMPVSGRGKVYIQGSSNLEHLELNLQPSFGV